MSVIKVGGETYRSVDDLKEAIAGIEIQLGDMPDGTPEHEKLAQHVLALRAAADNAGSGDAPASPAPDAEPEPEPSNDDEGNSEVETTHSLRDAWDNGKQVICPLCGHDIDFPETPPLDAFARRCDKCDGWGNVLTGSRVDGHVWRDCQQCNGQGFIQDGVTPIASVAAKAATVPDAPGAVWNAENENWDRPPGAQPPWGGAVWDSFLGKWS